MLIFLYRALGRITYQTISEVTFFMKVLHFSILNNIYIIHFIDKVCWTSQILGEKSWKKCDMFLLWVLLQMTKTRRRRPVHQNKQQNVIFFFKNFFKDLWSSANFVNEMDNIKIDHKRPTNIRYFMTNFWISSTSYANHKFFFRILRNHSCSLLLSLIFLFMSV